MPAPIFEPGDDLPPDGGGGGAPSIPGTQIVSVTFNKHETASALEVLAYVNLWSGDDLQLSGYLILDSEIIQAADDNLILDNNSSAGRGSRTFFAFVDPGVPAGQHTVRLTIVNREPDSALTVKSGATLKVTELKRGAL